MQRNTAKCRYLTTRALKPKEGLCGKLGRGSEVQKNPKRCYEDEQNWVRGSYPNLVKGPRNLGQEYAD